MGFTIRPRSCVCYASAKAHCDKRRPECSRCLIRAVDCHYAADTGRDTGSSAQHAIDAQTVRLQSVMTDPVRFENDQEMSYDSAIFMKSGFPDEQYPN